MREAVCVTSCVRFSISAIRVSRRPSNPLSDSDGCRRAKVSTLTRAYLVATVTVCFFISCFCILTLPSRVCKSYQGLSDLEASPERTVLLFVLFTTVPSCFRIASTAFNTRTKRRGSARALADDSSFPVWDAAARRASRGASLQLSAVRAQRIQREQTTTREADDPSANFLPPTAKNERKPSSLCILFYLRTVILFLVP